MYIHVASYDPHGARRGTECADFKQYTFLVGGGLRLLLRLLQIGRSGVAFFALLVNMMLHCTDRPWLALLESTSSFRGKVAMIKPFHHRGIAVADVPLWRWAAITLHPPERFVDLQEKLQPGRAGNLLACNII